MYFNKTVSMAAMALAAVSSFGATFLPHYGLSLPVAATPPSSGRKYSHHRNCNKRGGPSKRRRGLNYWRR